MNASSSFPVLESVNLLTRFAQNFASGWLQVSAPTTSWSFYLEQGRLIFASDSTSPLRRLDRHLRILSSQVPGLVSAVRVKLRLQFAVPPATPVFPSQDYQAICWLVSQRHLDPVQAAQLIEAIALEVLTDFKSAAIEDYRFIDRSELSVCPQFCQLELASLTGDPSSDRGSDRPPDLAPVSFIATRFRQPQRLSQPVSSKLVSSGASNLTLVKPSVADEPLIQRATSRAAIITPTPGTTQPTFRRTEEADTKPGESATSPVTGTPAKSAAVISTVWPPQRVSFSPNRVVDLATADSVPSLSALNLTPKSPLDLPVAAPANAAPVIASVTPPTSSIPSSATTTAGLSPSPSAPASTSFDRFSPRRTYTIVCVDDSPAILRAVESFLESESFAVVSVSDSVKALIEIVSHQTDLVLLDITMPKLNGYELCAMLRKHPGFRRTPIIMVTSSAGMLDRAKARLAGASGYLTKPFNQSDLIKTIFKHLGA